MAFLKFNKSELVNLSYSLKREIILASETGSYCNTSIITCNTRRYHGLLAVTLDRFGGDKYMLLSSLDESLIVDNKQFNLGIHCYGTVYEPRGHKYVIDYSADPEPQITYKVGEIVLKKSLLLATDQDQVMVKYELLESPSKVTVQLKPHLAFRNTHALTRKNDQADTSHTEINNGVSFRMYPNFPSLHLQLNTSKMKFVSAGYWNENITYSDEYRRGFDCKEDLYVPGYFELNMKKGDVVIFSASLNEENPSTIKRKYTEIIKKAPIITNSREQIVRQAEKLICNHNGHKMITAGLSWLYTGMLRETLISLPGITLYGKHSPAEFEEILDNLIADEQERLFRRTTQIEAPLYMACVLQQYIDYGADEKKVWEKYGKIIRGIIESYLPGERQEVSMQPNGLLWAQKENTALSWMNAYVDGKPVTERAGYQVETNALWYNAVCFAVDMEKNFGHARSAFVKKWSEIRDMIKLQYQPMFWNDHFRCLADYVDANGQNLDIRPNQLFALWVKNSPIDEVYAPYIIRVIDRELLTPRGIRTLSPRDVKYKGVYEGTQVDRDLAYHQGCTRPFLLEHYASVCFKVKGPAFWKKAEWLVEGFYEDLGKHGVGAFSELYDGDPPHEPHGAIASALSTAGLLAVDYMMEKYKEA